MRGKLPEQHDSWSCGHRIVVLVQFLLTNLPALGEGQRYRQRLDSFDVPPWVMSDNALKALIEGGGEKLDLAWAHREKRPNTDASTASPNKRLCQEIPQDNAPKLADAAVVEPEPIKSELSLVEVAGKKLAEREEKAAAKAMELRGKALVRKAGLDFNSDFQKAHRGVALPQEHWKEFLRGICGHTDVECSRCVQLVRKFSIDVVQPQQREEDKSGDKDMKDKQSQQQLVPTEPCCESTGQIVAYDQHADHPIASIMETPPKKRARRGMFT